MSASRAGVSAPEALVALLLGLLLVHLALDTLARVRSVQAALSARADLLLATRVGRATLRRELRHGAPERDWSADADSLALRAFRGAAVICGSDGEDELLVSYEGERAPDPGKDSVLLVTPRGATHVRALVSVLTAAEPCAVGAGRAQRWRLDGLPPERVAIARLFERGSYHLSGGALRWRPGAAGRQPLTPEVLSAGSAWLPSPSTLGVRLVPRDGAAGSTWSAFLAWRARE